MEKAIDFKKVVGGLPTAVLIADAKTRKLVYCNKAASKLTGYPLPKLIGMKADQLHPKDVRKGMVKAFKKQVNDSSYISETEIITEGGQRVPVAITTTRLELNGRQYQVGVFYNITLDVRLKRKLSAANMALRSQAGSMAKNIRQLAKSNARYVQLQKELVHERKWLQRVIRSAPDIVVGLDKNAKVVLFNHYAERTTGYKAKEVMGKDWIKVFIPHGMRNEIRKTWKQAIRTTGVQHHTNYILSKKGRKLAVIWDNIALRENGQLVMVLSMGRDITKLQEAEARLRESEEKFRGVAASALDAIILMGEDGRIAFWNRAAERMFGYSKKEAIGKMLHPFLAPGAYAAAAKKGLAKFKKSGKGPVVGKVLELSGRRKDGVVFPIELSLSSAKLSCGWCAIGIVRDISKRKELEEKLEQANKALRWKEKEMAANIIGFSKANRELKELKKKLEESETIYRELVEESPGGMVIVDTSGNIDYANRSLLRLTGFKKSEVVGKKFEKFVAPSSLNRAMKLFADGLHRKNPGPIPLVLHGKYGDIPMVYYYKIIRKNGRIAGFRAVLHPS